MRTFTINEAADVNEATDKEIDLFGVTSVNIEKRQTNDKQDTAYCEVKMSNDQYQATAYYVMIFDYYDKGGWQLDNYEKYNDTLIVPTGGYPKDKIISFLKDQYNYNSVEFVSSNKISDTSFSCKFKVSGDCPYAKEVGTVIVNQSFSKTKYYWITNVDTSGIISDWSSLIGKWTYKDSMRDFSVNIKNFDGKKISLSYSWIGFGFYGLSGKDRTISESGTYDNSGTEQDIGYFIPIHEDEPGHFDWVNLYVGVDKNYGVYFFQQDASPIIKFRCTKN